MIRAFKWRCVYATWLYWKEEKPGIPDDTYPLAEHADDVKNFYGMRAGYARYKYNVHMTIENALAVPATVQTQMADQVCLLYAVR